MSKKLKKWFLYCFLLVVSAFILIFLVISIQIRTDIKQQCKLAQRKYKGDCTKALMQILDSDSNSLRERNMAIWSLGQLGDDRALALLKKYYTGNIFKREPYNKTISQYELKKAIKLLEGGVNIIHLVW